MGRRSIHSRLARRGPFRSAPRSGGAAIAYAIADLVATSGEDGAVPVAWVGVAGEAVQQLQRSEVGSGAWTNVGAGQSGAGAKQVTDTGLTNGIAYLYRVVNGAGVAISPSRVAVPTRMTLADVSVAVTVGQVATFQVLPGAANGAPPYSLEQPN